MLVLDTLKLTEIFIECDDFCKLLDIHCSDFRELNEKAKSGFASRMSDSELMAIIIFFHHSGIRCFKWYYEHVLKVHFASYFPDLLSYSEFVSKKKRVFWQLLIFLQACRLAPSTEHNYIDSKPLVVCHNKRISRHKVFKNASRGKSSTGWFYGFKLHAIVNQYGQLVVFEVSPANKADNNPNLLRKITDKINGFLYGDKGYITRIKNELKKNGTHLITKIRSNMKKKNILTDEQKYYLRHRGIIESVFDLLKHHCQIEHSRHRSPENFLINILGALLAYTFMESTPKIPQFPKKVGKWTSPALIEIV